MSMMSAMHVRRFWVSGIVFAVAIALLPFSFHAERHLETATRVEGSQAETVRQELADRFRSPFVDQVVLVIQGLPPVDSEEGAQASESIVTALREQPGVSGVVSYLDSRDPIFLGRGGGTFVLVGLTSTDGPVELLVPKLHQLASSLENQLRGRYPAVKLELTGEIPLNFDIRKASSDDVQRGESLVIPATLALLLVAFGSLIAALIPLAVGQLAIATTLAITGFLAQRWHLSILVQNLATMLGLGLGIDYALLMVSRFREALAEGYDPGHAADLAAGQAGRRGGGFREALAEGYDPGHAADIAAGQAGRTLIISATTVAIGFSALLTVPISELRSIGIAGLLVTVLSVMLCTFILPWVLGLLGHRINAARVRLPARRFKTPDSLCAVSKRWVRWGRIITRRPWTALLVAGIPLLTLAFQARRISPGVPDNNSLPAGAVSVHG